MQFRPRSRCTAALRSCDENTGATQHTLLGASAVALRYGRRLKAVAQQ
jgi:hypothetical protein